MVALGHIFKEMGASYNQKLARVRAALILVHSDALSKLALSYTAFFRSCFATGIRHATLVSLKANFLVMHISGQKPDLEFF